MANFIPIGRFSKMTRLSIKALRRYDELGLLVPTAAERTEEGSGTSRLHDVELG